MTRDGAGTEAAPAPPKARGLRPLLPVQGHTAHGSDPNAPAGDSEDLAGKAATENFPVALRLLPPRYRARLMAVYNFARTVDDIGDEAPPDQRLRLLDEVDDDLDRVYRSGQGSTPSGEPQYPAVRGLIDVVGDCGIPQQCFRDLVEANRQDQVITRYEMFEDLLGYCALSANPVGQIVLHVFGSYTPERAVLSDAICSGLQVVEHLQDVEEDFRAGRVYLPAADMRSHGCTEDDLSGPVAPPQLRRLIAFELARAAALIDSGAPLVGELRGAARLAVAGYVAGGRAAIAAIALARHDILAATPKPTKGATARELVTLLVRGR